MASTVVLVYEMERSESASKGIVVAARAVDVYRSWRSVRPSEMTGLVA